ncbi:MAG: hypothetical protein AAGB24_08600 [Bacteroidota bacterium]
MFIKIYGKVSIADLNWSSVQNGELLRNFYEPVVKRSSKVFVQNSDHQVEILQVDDVLFPLTIAKKYTKNTCYLFSFMAQYIDYTREEILGHGKYSWFQKIVSRLVFPLLKTLVSWCGMEKVVFVNNLFLATNLYEKGTAIGHNRVIQYLKEHYTDSTIAFRSINEATDRWLLDELHVQGGLHLACRQLYILDPAKSNFKRKRPVIQDNKLWKTTKELFWEKLSRFDEKEIHTLLQYYSDLYRKKYSKLNPDYTLEFLQATIKSGVPDFYVLRAGKTNIPLAVQAVETTIDVVCTPFIGYDQTVPKKVGLYRLMNLQLTKLAIEEKRVFNMSSGAANFKKQRGGVPFFDYHVIFIDHLPKRRQWPWKQLHAISESKIKPTMRDLGV